MGGILGAVGAGVKILGGLAGLFGKKKKDPTPAQNLMSQAQGARDASAAYGFNPLTMMQYGQTGGAMGSGGGSSPLASIDLITGGLSGLDDVFSGDRARRDARNQLETDLIKIQLDTMRNGVVTVGPSGTDRVGSGRSPLGGRAVNVAGAGASERDRRHVEELVTTNSGEVVPVPVGPDIDEVISGFIIDKVGKAKSDARIRTLNNVSAPLTYPKFTPSASKPIPQYSKRPMPRQNWWQQRLNQPLRYNR